jgi:hypothetical protein
MSDNKQQTGVEWLLEQFDRNKMVMYNELGERTKVFTLINYEIIQQAKEMQKQMTIKLYNDYENYLEETFKNQNGGQAVILSFGAFYDQTYGEDDSIKINNGGHQI